MRESCMLAFAIGRSSRIRNVVYLWRMAPSVWRCVLGSDALWSKGPLMNIPVEAWQSIFTILMGLSASIGLLALLCPNVFAAMASYGNRAVFQGFQTSVEKRWFDIDKFVIAHGRFFGFLVVATVGNLWLISSYGPEAYSKSSMMIVVAVAMLMGIGSLCQIMRQSGEIEAHQAEAYTDALTGLANRRTFDLELSRRLAQRQRQGTPFCLLIIDIDNFKSFNDEFGHLLGDAILKKLAGILQTTARQMDVVARLGGDEFAVLLPDNTLDTASQGAERIRSAISDSPIRYEGHEHMLTVSIGLAEAQFDDDLVSLFKRSDSALYSAKEAGRNCSFRYGSPEPASPTPCK